MSRSLGAVRRPCRSAAAVAAAIALTSGCGLVGGPRTVAAAVPDRMTVSSPDVSRGVMGSAYTCHGMGKHPDIQWSGAPPGAKSFAVVMDDAAAPISPYIYWIVFNIGPQTTQIPPGAETARSSNGKAGYDPPCPHDQRHGYRFTVYALNRILPLQAGASANSAWQQIAKAAIARGRLTAFASP